jgi:2-polyprenyl-3-methyl-5-hydroxy-6-metoxy-1,4-benzoquinol methylase
MSNDTRKFFDGYSQGFDAIYGSRKTAFKKFVDNWLRKSMLQRYNSTLEHSQPIQGKTVLDVGCGPGHYSVALAKMGAARVVGIDFAPAMIDLARQLAIKEKVDTVCDFRVEDFFQMDKGEKFDYIVVMGVMDYIADPKAFIERTRQVCRGKVVFSFPFNHGFLAWQRKIRYKFKCPLYLYSRRQIEDLLKDIGPWQYTIEPNQREFFVTLYLTSA